MPHKMSCLNDHTSIIIEGIGSYIPERVMTNNDLSKMVDTSEEWIRSRTGIRERRIAADNENCSQMASKAARLALKNASVEPGEIDLVIVGTMTPDMLFPSTACLVQAELGLNQVPCFDVEAACSGFLYILDIAHHMLRSGSYKKALVIGAEKLSSILDWEDRSTCVLFGDGAGAVVLSRSTQPGIGVLDTLMGSDGKQADILCIPGGGSNVPASPASIDQRQHYLKMAGREVFKLAVKVMEQSSRDILNKHQIQPEQLGCIIPHQANLRIIELLSTRLKIPMEKFLVNVDRLGNTSAASIPLALDEALQTNRINSGDYILMVAFGAGLTWASTLIKWH